MWNTVRISYFNSNKRALVLEAIRPLVNQLRQKFQVNDFILKRHWKHGPHLDININCDKDTFTKYVYPECEAMLSAWLEENPSNEVLDESSYNELSKKLGPLEFEDGPFLPLYDNNKVFVGTYDNKAELYIDKDIVKAKEGLQVAAMDLLLDILAIPPADESARLIALAKVMAIIADGYPGEGMLYGHLSYRSHSEFYFSSNNNGEVMRQQFSLIDNKISFAIDDAISGLLESRDVINHEDKFASDWKRITSEFRNKVKPVIETDLHKFQTYDSFEKLSKKHKVYQFENNLPVNEFGKLMSESHGLSVFNSVDFQAHRLVINIFYTLLPLVEVSPKQKFLLCYLVSNSIERIYGTHWKQLIQKVG